MSTKNFFTIPNILSLLRIVLVPVFISLYINGNTSIAFFIFIISGVTDVLDGFIARKFNQISDYGKVLDPLADKLTLLTVLACLCFKRLVPWFLFILILAKELFQIIGGIFLWKKKIVVHSNIWGKLTTIMFYAGISAIFLWPTRFIGNLLLGVALVFAIIAVYNYTLNNKKLYNEKKKEGLLNEK